ncbi:MAG: MotA/TolQ/ExbB proton channel family protein [Gammaproteobacteria bacterium]|nr:MotA/TolQ/ExbB proton channel family protein [Gammaproteobacteria bacterium]
MNIAEIFDKGGLVVWILAGYSAVGLAIVIERYLLILRQRRLPKERINSLDRLLDQPDAITLTSSDRGPEARTVQAILHAQKEGVMDLQAVGERVLAVENARMGLGLRTLGILANTAPLLGLLGTITGMIKAFMVIEQAGGKVDAQALAGGIWEAMITTGVGLAVAIPLTILLHFLEGAMERRSRNINQCISRLLERRKPCNTPNSQPVGEEHLWTEVTDGL